MDACTNLAAALCVCSHKAADGRPGASGLRATLDDAARAAPGGVAERSNAAALKAVDRVLPVRGFESLPLRSSGLAYRARMARHTRLRELLVAIEGLALHRHLYDGSDEAAARRLGEVRRILGDEAFVSSEATVELDPRVGYRAWSETYDEPGNPIIAVEEPVVRSILDRLPIGRALDAACGTGRHARHLAERGHEVVGIDVTPEMLRRAEANVPQASFLVADLGQLPMEDEQFDLVVCALALAHLERPMAAIAELARVLRLGGRLVISVLHPFLAHLGWHALFEDGRGQRRFVREHPHPHADYLAAFRSLRLGVRDCREPALRAEQLGAMRRASRHIPDATIEAYAGLPGVLVWDLEKEGDNP
jgi:SAM-dependent methyltransferase